MSAVPGDTSAATLPPLRRDIHVVAGPSDRFGAPQWILHDPLQARYFQVSETTRVLLESWEAGLTAGDFLDRIRETHGLRFSPRQLAELLSFLRRNNLDFRNTEEDWPASGQPQNPPETSFILRAFRAYLFVKVPILKPQRLLQRAMPLAEPFFHLWAALTIVVIGVAGLYLTSRQWDQFADLIISMVSWEGSIYFAIALIVAKALHELAHAFAAIRHGCRVPTMGIAFFLLMPLPYTDVSDAWRLPSRKHRLAISAAGVVAELGLAAIALLVWSFVPEGHFQSVAATVATTSIAMSLVFNLNPCMKFDGYYLLSDLIGIDNLHARSFAMGRWKLRQITFAPALPPPERLSRGMTRFLVVFAWVTWLYRVFIFTAIALLVYHYCFKLLGLILLVAELWYFIVRPVLRELRDWLALNRRLVSPSRVGVSALVMVALLAVLALPWRTNVQLPGVLLAREVARIYPPQAAKILDVSVTIGDQVAQGDIIARLTLPRLDHEIEAAIIKVDQLTLRLASTERSDLDEALVLRSERAALQSRLKGLLEEHEALAIRAPISGIVAEIDRDAHVGRWVAKTDPILLITAPRDGIVRGYLPETDHWRVRAGKPARFIPDDLNQPSIPLTLTRISTAGVDQLELPELGSTHGGGVDVRVDPDGRLVPKVAQYLVELTPDRVNTYTRQVVRGSVMLEASAESILGRLSRAIATVITRESGF